MHIRRKPPPATQYWIVLAGLSVLVALAIWFGLFDAHHVTARAGKLLQ